MVRQSNELIQASYKIASVGEGRLIRMLIAQIKPTDEDFKTYQISVADFAKFFGLSSGGSAYDLVKKAADELAGRRIMLEKDGNWLRLNWLAHAKYKAGDGFIEVSFHKELKPYLLQLQTYYTQYELEKIVNFKSVYAMRLFELLKQEQFKGKGNESGYFKKSFEYEELRGLLGIEKKEYSFFKDFRVIVLQTAIKEINANPDIHIIQVDYPKTGRKISHIVFHCEKAKQTQLDVDEPEPKLVETRKEHPEYIKELVSMGIDEDTAYKWKKKYGVNRLTRSIAYTRAMQKVGKVRDNLPGYLARTIADNVGGAWETEQKAKQEALKAQREAEKKQKQLEQEQAKTREIQRNALMLSFHSLPQEEQVSIRSAFEAQLDYGEKLLWNTAKKANSEQPETHITVFVLFLRFYSVHSLGLT